MHNSNRRDYLASGILLAVISLMSSLLFAEAFVRFFLKDEIDTELLKSHLEGTSIRSLIQPSENPTIFFELKPNLNTYFQDSLVVTSADGYRTSGQERTSHKDVVRIAVLGDSTSFGWRVDYEDTYPEKFRRQMEAQTKVPIDLRNYSVPGYNSQQEFHLFLDKVIPYQPNLLILHYDHNDVQPTGVGYPPNYIPPEYGDNPLNSALIKFTLRRLKTFQNQNNIKFSQDEHKYDGGYIIGGPLYDAHLSALQNLIAQAQSLNIPTIIIIFDTFIRADQNFEENQHYLYHKEFDTYLEKMGFYVLDMYPHFQTKMLERDWSDLSNWWISTKPIDGHPNPEGHQFIADRLANYIELQPDLMNIFKPEVHTLKSE